MQCLFCQSPDVDRTSFPRPTFFNNKRFEYYQCNNCKLVFIDPIPSSDDYANMYAPTYHDTYYFKESEIDYSFFYELLEKNTTGKNILDYGCGDGSFLHYFSQRGYDCTGIDYDMNLVERLRERFPGIKFYDITKFHLQKEDLKFDIIYMGDVLEHLDNPSQFLNSLLLNLNDGGLILVQGPLEGNFTLALSYRKLISSFKKNRVASHTPYHISFSNAKNQKRIFEESGFVTLYYKISEAPWPYPSKFTLKPMPAINWVVAKTSILISKFFPGKWGNRFVYLGKKPQT